MYEVFTDDGGVGLSFGGCLYMGYDAADAEMALNWFFEHERQIRDEVADAAGWYAEHRAELETV